VTDLRQQTFDELRCSRRSDPQTSKDAARHSRRLAHAHEAEILRVLAGGGHLTAHEIAERCGLASIQVSRRLGHMRDDGDVVVADGFGTTPSGCKAQRWRLP